MSSIFHNQCCRATYFHSIRREPSLSAYSDEDFGNSAKSPWRDIWCRNNFYASPYRGNSEVTWYNAILSGLSQYRQMLRCARHFRLSIEIDAYAPKSIIPDAGNITMSWWEDKHKSRIIIISSDEQISMEAPSLFIELRHEITVNTWLIWAECRPF